MRAISPGPTPVTSPLLLTVATEIFDEVQEHNCVISWVDPSLFIPMATNCWKAPTGMDGITATDDRVAEVTVSVVVPEILPEVAVMLVAPAVTAVARPLLLTVATEVLDELQLTCEVKSWLVPSENVPVAANCPVLCRGVLGLAGVIDREPKVAEVTVSPVFPEILPEVAVMVAVPVATAVARPLLLTVTTKLFDETQVVTSGVISWLVPSEYVPRAFNCWLTPAGTLGLAGVTVMEDSVAEVTVKVMLPERLSKLAVMVAVPAATAVASPLPLTVATEVLDEIQETSGVIT
jgi:hypothetical protein